MKALSPLFILHSVHHSADHTDNMLPTLCVLLPALAWVSSQKVLTQTPSVLTEQQGKTISMDCNIAEDESNYVHWYKQIPQSAPQYVLTSDTDGSPIENGDNFPSSRFTSKASSNIDYQLIISNVEVGDSAVYYCCTLNDSPFSTVVFGPGTKLIVTDSAVPPPVLSIFPPSSEELKSNKATLVCVVSDMSTGIADVRWLLDRKAVSSGVSTGSAEQQPNKKFRLSSYLSIERSEWEKDKDITCEVSAAASKTTSKSMKKSECMD
ncbi:immunoglobulin lambda-1 light chain-like [Astyanax mexicanus]|uniref:immunoglobulin lambda-1 light chain-like n=1 Tax=Astyanax mexicanus TaxID=7994 RepID=UPI0020CB3649|nr:immunoglobulin lambda-1 light chain-like [Astyanax mexicanus]